MLFFILEVGLSPYVSRNEPELTLWLKGQMVHVHRVKSALVPPCKMVLAILPVWSSPLDHTIPELSLDVREC